MSGNHSRFKLIFWGLFQLFIGHDARITPSDQLKKSSKIACNLSYTPKISQLIFSLLLNVINTENEMHGG
jgi:hypothetical protein